MEMHALCGLLIQVSNFCIKFFVNLQKTKIFVKNEKLVNYGMLYMHTHIQYLNLIHAIDS